MKATTNRWAAVFAVLALGSLLLVAMASAHSSVTKYPATEVAAGKKIFVANCGKCHVLLQAKSHGAVGPNLNTVKPTPSFIINQVTNGGRFMPPFGAIQGGPLSTTQVKDVAAFVYTSEH